MSPPYGVSQECWDNNVRLAREMQPKPAASRPTRSSSLLEEVERSLSPRTVPRGQLLEPAAQAAIPPFSTQSNTPTYPSARPAQLSAERPSIQRRGRTLLNRPPAARTQPRLAHNLLSQPLESIMGQQRSRTPTRLTPSQQQASEWPIEQPSAYTSANTSYIDLTEPEEPLTFYVCAQGSPQGQVMYKPCPDYLSTYLPPFKTPRDPRRISQLLQFVEGEVFFVGFRCQCRNLGTCIHYQVAFDRSKLPDGLICQLCSDAPQRVIQGKRKCPQHQDDTGKEKAHIESSLQDFLPTDKQHERYAALMEKCMTGNWEGIESAAPVWKGKEPDRTPITPRRMLEPVPLPMPTKQASLGRQVGLATATPRAMRAPGPVMPQPRIEPLTDIQHQQKESKIMARGGVSDETRQTQTDLAQLEEDSNLAFFDRNQPLQDWELALFGLGTDDSQPQIDPEAHWDSSVQPSGTEVGEVVAENVVPATADLRTIESGANYERTMKELEEFVSGSGQLG